MKKTFYELAFFNEQEKTTRMEKADKILMGIIKRLDTAEETAKKYADDMMDISALLNRVIEKTAENDSKKCQIYANGVHQGTLIGENNNHQQINMFIGNLYANGIFQVPIKVHISTHSGQQFYYILNTEAKFLDFVKVGLNEGSEGLEQTITSYKIMTSE